ncbi:MAG: molybdopterin-dependent oxidoreductase [Acidobacteria bacterium]|nr:molybdopterin-dependent oxidoreductase [Acidobacteriota bacterium]
MARTIHPKNDEAAAGAQITEQERAEPQPSHYRTAKTDERGPAETLPAAGDPAAEVDPRGVSAQPPEESGRPELGAPKESAAGAPAVVSAMKYSLKEMGAGRTLKTLLRVNQQGGFDCPGCAWPEPDRERAHAEFCENGAKHVADEATTKRVTPAFFKEWGVRRLSEQSDVWLNAQGRLAHPMLLRSGADHYEPVGWDEAFKLMAGELNSLASPDEAVFYTSGRASNEAAFLYQLFVRQFGTNNLPDCSNMCHESSGAGLTASIGVGKGTVTLDDFAEASAVFVIGQNPGTNHPRMLSTLQAAKRRGCRIVHVNPLPEAGMKHFKHPQEVSGWLGAGTQLADLFLQVRINGDVALLKGIAKEVLEEESRRPGEVLDHDFIREHTKGFDEYAAGIDEASWDEITEGSGITREEMREAARVFVESERTIICWAMGLTQHRNAVANVQEIVNLLLLRGQLGKPGAGACPVRGHSNVQGDRTMGIWERPTDAFKLNRAHLVTGEQALILPCLGRTERDSQAAGEQFVSCENSMGVVQSSRGNLRPASEHLLSEVAIVARLAAATLGARSEVDWAGLAGDYDLIRAAIERTIPGFDDYNRRVREPGGFYLPNLARARDFKTASGKAEFTVHELPRHDLAPGQFLMMTIRSHDQFNTTVYSLDDRYRGVSGGRRVVFLNPEDVREAGLAEGEAVDLVSHFEGEERVARNFSVVPYPIPRRCAATYFPEANVLVPVGHVAERSNTPASKSVVISLRRS